MRSDLEKVYRAKTDDELIDIATRADLSPDAVAVLNRELSSRGLTEREVLEVVDPFQIDAPTDGSGTSLTGSIICRNCSKSNPRENTCCWNCGEEFGAHANVPASDDIEQCREQLSELMAEYRAYERGERWRWALLALLSMIRVCAPEQWYFESGIGLLFVGILMLILWQILGFICRPAFYCPRCRNKLLTGSHCANCAHEVGKAKPGEQCPACKHRIGERPTSALKFCTHCQLQPLPDGLWKSKQMFWRKFLLAPIRGAPIRGE